MNKLLKLIAAIGFGLMVSLSAIAEQVNLNKADAATIAAGLKGIGPAKAKAIVAHRKANGPFKSIEELTAVKGIGLKTLDMNRSNLKGLSADGKMKKKNRSAVKSKDSVKAKSSGKAKGSTSVNRQDSSKEKTKAKTKEKGKTKASDKKKSPAKTKVKTQTK